MKTIRTLHGFRVLHAFAAALLSLLVVAGVQAHDGAERGYIGVSVDEETQDSEGGARIESIVSGSPADEADLRAGDVIQGIGGNPVRGPRGLGERLEEHTPGDLVTLDVLRDGSRMTVDLELTDRSTLRHGFDRSSEDWTEWTEEFGERMAEFGERMGQLGEHMGEKLGDGDPWLSWTHHGGSRPRLGVQLVEATPELREHLGGDAGAGVLVAKVLDATPADDSGVRVGDLIVGLDGEVIEDPSDLRHALAEHVGSTFDLDIVRDARPVRLRVTLPEEPDGIEGPRASVFPARPLTPMPPMPPATNFRLPMPPRFQFDLPAPPAPEAPPPPPPKPVAQRAV